jgi:hypothetical protein
MWTGIRCTCLRFQPNSSRIFKHGRRAYPLALDPPQLSVAYQGYGCNSCAVACAASAAAAAASAAVYNAASMAATTQGNGLDPAFAMPCPVEFGSMTQAMHNYAKWSTTGGPTVEAQPLSFPACKSLRPLSSLPERWEMHRLPNFASVQEI